MQARTTPPLNQAYAARLFVAPAIRRKEMTTLHTNYARNPGCSALQRFLRQRLAAAIADLLGMPPIKSRGGIARL